MARDKYLVLRSDPVLPVDVPVRRCATRAEAVALAARLNRRVQAAYGRPRPGKLVPLYFAERAG
jgi:NADH:ubiquinone oxidoreductase subunit B-like Fe-S oxidoreductase